MTTVYANVNDLAADPSKDPTEVAGDVGAVTGVLGSTLGISATGGSTQVLPMFGYAGSLATIDDTLYVDAGDGTIGGTSRFWPGSGGAQGYLNEKLVKDAEVTEGPNYRANLETVGVQPDTAVVMGLV